jgi:peptidoglycan L-alanyl-D-glutamate endopeptidase CwlK
MSRDLNELLPVVRDAAKRALTKVDELGIDVLVTCTYRDPKEQARLYAQGRTTPGRKVTNAKPGQSFHEYRVAIDLYPLINGKPDFSGSHVDLWKKIAQCFKDEGFEWAYEWKTFKEMPHFQMTKGHPLSYFQNGGKI